MSDSRYLQAADVLGARLCRDALWSGDRCNWLGDSMEFLESRWQVTHRAFGPSLYNGTSGIALFLAHLFAFTGDKIFRRTSEAALRCALSQMEVFDAVNGFGFYSGLTGIAYTLIQAGELFADDLLVGRGLEMLEQVSHAEPSSQQSWDIVSGSAGVIPVLLKIGRHYGRESLIQAAQRHGRLILQAANRGNQGWSWKTIGDQAPKDLTGYSHGVAGIAWALLELHQQLKEEAFLEAAREALKYERHAYDPQQENWPDFRSFGESGEQVFAAAWCHGAPGIGLSRLRAYQLLREEECLKEAQAAIRTTIRMLQAALASGQGNYSLCHGNCGNAELLILAAGNLKDEESLKVARQVADSGIEIHLLPPKPWPCGVLNGGETPNLMLGLAGIGYFYLRMHAPAKVPSVLLVGPELLQHSSSSKSQIGNPTAHSE